MLIKIAIQDSSIKTIKTIKTKTKTRLYQSDFQQEDMVVQETHELGAAQLGREGAAETPGKLGGEVGLLIRAGFAAGCAEPAEEGYVQRALRLKGSAQRALGGRSDAGSTAGWMPVT